MVPEELGKAGDGRAIGHLLTRGEAIPMRNLVLLGGVGEPGGRSDWVEVLDCAGLFMAKVGDGAAESGAPGGFRARGLELAEAERGLIERLDTFGGGYAVVDKLLDNFALEFGRTGDFAVVAGLGEEHADRGARARDERNRASARLAAATGSRRMLGHGERLRRGGAESFLVEGSFY